MIWAKTPRPDQQGCSLVEHARAAAEACGALWTGLSTAGLRSLWGEWLGETEPVRAASWLAYLVALHDLGKATPGFQARSAVARRRLTARGFPFPRAASDDHERLGAVVLREVLQPLAPGWAPGALAGLGEALAHHHGTRRREAGPGVSVARDLGGPAWQVARRALAEGLAAQLGVGVPLPPGLAQPTSPLLTLLGGLVRLCDWLASANGARPPEVPTPRPGAQDFLTRFGFAPNALQSAAADLPPGRTEPELFLIEAPPGTGKTEAALWLAERGLAAGAAGTYLALPTRTTARAMQERAVLPGAAAPLLPSLQRQAGPLLAPEAVGTLDQALLALLGGPHSSLRWLGLAGKTVILDEVHTYDAYTGALLERLLGGLRALQCTVVLLSATLPAARRRRLLRAWGGGPGGPATRASASVTRLGRAAVATRQVPDPAPRTVEPSWLAADAALADHLATALAHGGCAVLFRNTVRGAQETYEALQPLLAAHGVAVSLLHGQYPAAALREREATVRRQFGRDPAHRPGRSVLVTTPLAEQSLDLDFDLLVSEVAPAPHLLQRLGRLHRFPAPRPPALATPRLWLLTPPTDADGLPDFGASTAVYAEADLLAAYLHLRARPALRLPSAAAALLDEAPPLPPTPAWQARWERARATARAAEEELVWAGRVACSGAAVTGDDWRPAPLRGRRGSPTRWAGVPTSRVVMLAEPVGGGQPGDAEVAALLDRVIAVPGRELAEQLRAQPRPPGWEGCAGLREVWPVVVGAGGDCRLGRLTLRLDAALGLVMRRTEGVGA